MEPSSAASTTDFISPSTRQCLHKTGHNPSPHHHLPPYWGCGPQRCTRCVGYARRPIHFIVIFFLLKESLFCHHLSLFLILK